MEKAIAKLDLVLDYIYNHISERGYTDANFISHFYIREKPETANWQLETFPIIKRLEKDGYVLYKYTETPKQGEFPNEITVLIQHRVYLTFDGIAFKEQGGYLGAAKQNELAKIQSEMLQENQTNLQTNQTLLMEAQTRIQNSVKSLTRWLVAAAIAAFIVSIAGLLWDIWKFNHPYH